MADGLSPELVLNYNSDKKVMLTVSLPDMKKFSYACRIYASAYRSALHMLSRRAFID